MTICPAPPANAAERPSAEQPSEHGTQPAPSSGLDGLTLFERLMVERMDILISQQDEILRILADDGEEFSEAPATHYLNGQRIS